MPDVTDLPALDVAIGLAFVYALLALIASGVNELVARGFSMRSRYLENGLRNLLNDPNGSGLAKDVLRHPLIRGLSRHGATDDPKPKETPSYIPARTFAIALLDTIAPPADASDSQDVIAKASTAVAKIENEQVRQALQSLLRGARGDLDAFRQGIESWFDEAMDRVSGWYKRWSQTVLLVLGIGTAAAFNADTIQIANSLWHDDTVRAAVVNQATKAQAPTGKAEDKAKAAAKQVNRVKELSLPIGWDNAKGDPRRWPGDDPMGWLGKVLGILVTGLAVSLGAPFWFDAIGKATRLKSSGPKPKANEPDA